MILHLDTSSVVKIYVEERHSAEVRAWVEEAELVTTCRITYPEACAALARRQRSGDIGRSDFTRVVEGFEADWPAYMAIDFAERSAGRLALKHGLKGADAVHLSSAMLARDAHPDLPIVFSSFDRQLVRAAQTEGLHVLTAEG